MKHASDRSVWFWSKVNKTGGCWLWTGPMTEKGYGRFYHNYQASRAHRVAYELCVGPVPAGVEICHRCDNPACVNPDHLFVGSHKDNMADMSRKDRGARLRGQRNGMAKLTPEAVAEIRAKHTAGGVSQRQLAKVYSVSQGTIWQIVNGHYWKPNSQSA